MKDIVSNKEPVEYLPLIGKGLLEQLDTLIALQVRLFLIRDILNLGYGLEKTEEVADIMLGDIYEAMFGSDPKPALRQLGLI